jgi:hypothetical protein
MPPLETIIGWRICLTGGGGYSETLRTMTMKTGNVIYRITPFRTVHDILRFIIPFLQTPAMPPCKHLLCYVSLTNQEILSSQRTPFTN